MKVNTHTIPFALAFWAAMTGETGTPFFRELRDNPTFYTCSRDEHGIMGRFYSEYRLEDYALDASDAAVDEEMNALADTFVDVFADMSAETAAGTNYFLPEDQPAEFIWFRDTVIPATQQKLAKRLKGIAPSSSVAYPLELIEVEVTQDPQEVCVPPAPAPAI